LDESVQKGGREKHGQGDEDVEKLRFELYGTTKNTRGRASNGSSGQNSEKKNFSPIQRVFHKKCESTLAGFCRSTTNFALFGELPLKRNKSGK
jgi:hypothetical protein